MFRQHGHIGGNPREGCVELQCVPCVLFSSGALARCPSATDHQHLHVFIRKRMFVEEGRISDL